MCAFPTLPNTHHSTPAPPVRPGSAGSRMGLSPGLQGPGGRGGPMGRGLWPAAPRLLPWLLAPGRGPGLQGLPRGGGGPGLDCLLLQPPAELSAASWPSGDPGPQPGAPHRCLRAPQRGVPLAGGRQGGTHSPAYFPSLLIWPLPPGSGRSEALKARQSALGRQALFPRAPGGIQSQRLRPPSIPRRSATHVLWS